MIMRADGIAGELLESVGACACATNSSSREREEGQSQLIGSIFRPRIANHGRIN